MDEAIWRTSTDSGPVRTIVVAMVGARPNPAAVWAVLSAWFRSSMRSVLGSERRRTALWCPGNLWA